MIFTVQPEDKDKRVDRFLAENQDVYTRSALERLFYGGTILVNGFACQKNYRLCPNDKIEILTPQKSHESDDIITVKPKYFSIDVVYEDAELLVVNKPRGMSVHPVSCEDDNTLVSALLYYCGGNLSTTGDPLRPGIVHRIDKDTSGILVVAKTDIAHKNLALQAESHTMLRRYEGIVHGGLKQNSGVIDLAVGRHPVYRTKRAVLSNEATGARHAVTKYSVIARYNGFCHVEFELETGRTHQIRVHMAHIGHPVAGDPLYGPAKPVKSLNGQCLHARTLGFVHPATGEELVFTSELPAYFTDFLKRISGDTGFND